MISVSSVNSMCRPEMRRYGDRSTGAGSGTDTVAAREARKSIWSWRASIAVATSSIPRDRTTAEALLASPSACRSYANRMGRTAMADYTLAFVVPTGL